MVKNPHRFTNQSYTNNNILILIHVQIYNNNKMITPWLIQLNLLNRTCYSPKNLHLLYPPQSPRCYRCNKDLADLCLMLWDGNKLKYWGSISIQLGKWFKKQIICDSSVALLRETDILSDLNYYQQNGNSKINFILMF